MKIIYQHLPTIEIGGRKKRQQMAFATEGQAGAIDDSRARLTREEQAPLQIEGTS